MSAEVRNRIALVGRLLTALQGKGDAYRKSSEMQARVVKGLLMRSSLSLEEQTEVVEALDSVPWQAEQHRDEVFAAFASGPVAAIAGQPSAKSTSARRPMQDFGSILQFYTADQWEFLLGEGASPSQKLSVVLEQAHVLGLRCASEPTVQRITTLYLCVTEGFLGAKGMAGSQKLAMVKHIKQQLKRLGDSPPAEFIEKLPVSPSKLQTDHPLVYESAFRAKVAAPMKLDLNSFVDVEATVPCRGKRGDLCNFGGDSFQAVASGFMQQMQQMQMATFQALTNGGQATRPPSVVSGMAFMPSLLSASSGSPSQGELHIQDLRPPLQLQTSPRQEQQPVEPEEQQPVKEQQPVGPVDLPVGPVEQEQLPVSSKTPRLSVADQVALISSAIDDRTKAGNAKAKAKAKGTAKVKGKAKAKAAGKSEVGKQKRGGTWRPSYDVVSTRQHVQCRTGLKGPGQYKAISFFKAGGEEKAIELGKQWVQEQLKRGKP